MSEKDQPVVESDEDVEDALTEPAASDSNPAPSADASPSRVRRFGKLVRDWGLTLIAVVVVMQVVGWWRAPDLPEMAPEFTLKDLDGQSVALADMRGSVVVLNFWADWCMPCRAEIPSFSRFARNHPDIKVYGIAADGNATSIRKAAADLGIDYPVLVGDRATMSAYGVTTLPTTIVVGPDGEVRSAHTGIMLGPQISFAVRD